MSNEKDNNDVVRSKKSAAREPQTIDGQYIARASEPIAEPATTEFSFGAIKRIGLILVLVVFGGFGSWAMLAPIEGAAHAPALVTVKSYKRVIQHFEGGIVAKLYVQNGDVVKAGDPLVELDRTQPEGQLEMASAQLTALSALEARLLAERNKADQITFPTALRPDNESARAEMQAQEQIFRARKASVDGGVDVLEQRIEQLRSRLEGLRAQKSAKEALAASFADEMSEVEILLQDGFADRNRLRTLERSHASYQGEAAELVSTISATDMQIGETRLQILQQENEFQSDVVTRLSDTQTRLADTRERVTVLTDILDRTIIRAPVEGIVTGMQIHTEGGVIGAGSPLAEIVPQSDELVVEAKVSPADIDRVTLGQKADIRFSSFGGKTPVIYGEVINLSADAIIESATGASFYLARIAVPPENLLELGDLSLVPGMPAEVFINSGSRTFFQYSTKPFSDAMARSLKED